MQTSRRVFSPAEVYPKKRLGQSSQTTSKYSCERLLWPLLRVTLTRNGILALTFLKLERRPLGHSLADLRLPTIVQESLILEAMMHA